MRAPAFWWREGAGGAATLLKPVGALYGAVTARRMARAGERAAVPVVCVGNLVAGGAGKTPAAIAVATILRHLGHSPAFLSRGHGRNRAAARDDSVLRVEPGRDDARSCGDEPLLLAAVAPTYVAVDRREAAQAAITGGATILVMDDGLQNPALVKDFTLAVADGVVGVGNGLCVPAGPLRAPVARQWPFVSMLCVVGEGAAGERLSAGATKAGLPMCAARVEPDKAVVAALSGQCLYAFAGIGRPEKFYTTLKDEGLAVVGQQDFPDHHAFTAVDLENLRHRAEQAGALLVTTAKDMVKLPPDFPAVAVPIMLVLDDAEALTARLAAL